MPERTATAEVRAIETRYGPSIEIDSRALELDEYFLLMSNRQLGKFFRKLADDVLAGVTEFDFPQRSQFKLIRKVHPGRTKRAGRSAIPRELRQSVLSIGSCLHCGSIEKLTVDHITPYSKGGPTERENLQCLCRPCNSRKGAR